MKAILRGHPHPSFLQGKKFLGRLVQQGNAKCVKYVNIFSEIPVDDGIYGDTRPSSWLPRHRITCPDFNQMDLRHTKGESEIPVSFVIRMKCILAKRSAGLVSNSFKVSRNDFFLKILRL